MTPWGGSSLELYGVIQNLTNKSPPVVGTPSDNPFSIGTSALYDTIGRQFRLGVRLRY
jgi:hypothetical protein